MITKNFAWKASRDFIPLTSFMPTDNPGSVVHSLPWRSVGSNTVNDAYLVLRAIHEKGSEGLSACEYCCHYWGGVGIGFHQLLLRFRPRFSDLIKTRDDIYKEVGLCSVCDKKHLRYYKRF